MMASEICLMVGRETRSQNGKIPNMCLHTYRELSITIWDACCIAILL